MPTPGFSHKVWKDQPDHTTPISAAALEDLEDRVTQFALDTASTLSSHFKGVWSSGTPYSLGDGVSVGTTNYISTVAGVSTNVNNNPVGDNGSHWTPAIPASVVSASPLPSAVGQGPVWSGSLWVPTGVEQTEARTVPYTVYVDLAIGSDSNLGNSPGQEFQTLPKAINTLQQAPRGGLIRIVGVVAGNIDVAAPVAFVQAINIEAITPSGATIRRTFTTPNSRSVFDAVTTVGSTTITSATGAFSGPDVNRIVSVYGAGVGGGTYYDFIASVTNSTHVVVANGSGTAVARDTTTDPAGVKMSVVGDWNRVVTDAGIVAAGSVVTSATASWTSADIGTELVIAGAGQGGQALRGAIKAVSGTTATITAIATNTVTNKRCAIGVNFGSLFTYHGLTGGQGGLRNLVLTDETGSTTTIGAAIDFHAPDQGSGAQSNPADMVFAHLRLTASAASWEHMIAGDGSWNQATGGPGVRRVKFTGVKVFGARTPGETVRLVSMRHVNWDGHGIVGQAPAGSTAQGYRLLDPVATAGGPSSCGQNNFVGCEGEGAYFYCEGQWCSYMGGQLSALSAISGRRVIELAPISDHCTVVTNNTSTLTGLNADEYDAGTNNRIETGTSPRRLISRALDSYVPSGWLAETFSRNEWGANNVVCAVGSSGVEVLSQIWLPGGLLISKVGILANGALTYGAGWTGANTQAFMLDPDGNIFCSSAAGTPAVSSLTTFTMSPAARVPRTGLCWIGLLVYSGTGGSGFVYPTFSGFLNNTMAPLNKTLTGTSGAGLTAPAAASVPPGTTFAGRLYQLVG